MIEDIKILYKEHLTNPHSCVRKRLNCLNWWRCWCGDTSVCLRQTHQFLSCAFRPTAPQTLHFIFYSYFLFYFIHMHNNKTIQIIIQRQIVVQERKRSPLGLYKILPLNTKITKTNQLIKEKRKEKEARLLKCISV